MNFAYKILNTVITREDFHLKFQTILVGFPRQGFKIKVSTWGFNRFCFHVRVSLFWFICMSFPLKGLKDRILNITTVVSSSRLQRHQMLLPFCQSVKFHDSLQLNEIPLPFHLPLFRIPFMPFFLIPISPVKVLAISRPSVETEKRKSIVEIRIPVFWSRNVIISAPQHWYLYFTFEKTGYGSLQYIEIFYTLKELFFAIKIVHDLPRKTI